MNKSYKENFLFDLKNVVVLRLFASEEFVLVPKDKIKTVEDLKKAIEWKNFEKIDNLPKKMNKKDFRDNLVFVFENERLLDNDNLSKKLKNGPS